LLAVTVEDARFEQADVVVARSQVLEQLATIAAGLLKVPAAAKHRCELKGVLQVHAGPRMRRPYRNRNGSPNGWRAC